jgi:outer membrane protein TolC
LTRIKQLESALATDEEILNLRKNITRQSEKRLDQGIITMSDYLTDYNAELKAGLQFRTHKIQFIQSKANYLVIKGQL